MKNFNIGEKSYLNNLNYLKRTFKKSNRKSIFNKNEKNNFSLNKKNDLNLIKNKLNKKNNFFPFHKKIKSFEINEKSTFYNSTLTNNFSNRIFSNENLISIPKIYDITKDLKKIKKNKKIAKFTTTNKLNHYIINEFNYESKENYQKKLKTMEKTFNIVRQKKNQEIYERSQNYYVEDKERDEFYYKLANENKNNSNENFNNLKTNENYIKNILNEYYLNKKEKNLKSHEKIFKKIWFLNDEEYESIDEKEDFTLSVNNLKRLMKIKKYKKKFLSPDLTKKKQIFYDEQDKILLKMKKLQPGNLIKRPFKKSTEKTFKSVSGVFFGLPN
jgi:hypothetical protein